ncbi:MAG: hypothetical protein AAF928_20715 [Myxococcota bacterium]
MRFFGPFVLHVRPARTLRPALVGAVALVAGCQGTSDADPTDDPYEARCTAGGGGCGGLDATSSSSGGGAHDDAEGGRGGGVEDPPSLPSDYDDDTFEAGSGLPQEALPSRFDYAAYLDQGTVNPESYLEFDHTGASGLALDLRGSHFLVDNNDEPFEPDANHDNRGAGCENGPEPVNRYPITIRRPDITVVGGLMHGFLDPSGAHVGIPQGSDWNWTYCNSAALLFKGAERGRVDGIRITSSWDAIRVDADFTIRNSWLSRVRDDAVENDDHHAGQFIDSLVDGAFQVFSQRDDNGGGGANRTFTVRGSVIRIASSIYNTSVPQRFGSILKTDTNAPTVVLKNTVIAIEPDAFEPGAAVSTWAVQWARAWARVDPSQCENNALLWIPNGSHPSVGDVLDAVLDDMPSSCFSVVETTPEVARPLWDMAKKNWIDCHPKVGRTKEDPASDPAACQAGTYGGFTD